MTRKILLLTKQINIFKKYSISKDSEIDATEPELLKKQHGSVNGLDASNK